MAAIEDAAAPLLAKPKTRAEAIRATIKSMKQNAGGIAAAMAKGALMQGVKKVTGSAVAEISELIDGAKHKGEESELALTAEAIAEGAAEALHARIETLLNAEAAEQVNLFRRGQSAITDFKTDLGALTSQLVVLGRTPPLYVLVDELDRCRPTYGISLLKRAKHLFDVDDVVFIIATDTVQLASAIRAVYGQDFESGKYLGRFFDRTYQFDEPDVGELVDELLATMPINEALFSVPPDQTLAGTLVHVFNSYSTTPRDVHRAFDLLRTVASTWSYAMPIELTAILPLILAKQASLEGTWEDPATRDALKNPSSRVKALTWRYRGQKLEPETAKFLIANAMGYWLSHYDRSLPDVNRQSHGDPIGDWVLSRLQAEWAKAHKNIHGNDGGPHSILRDYPGIIRKAGRFSK